MKTVISDAEDMGRLAALRVKELLEKKPGAVLALTAGRSTAGLYAELSRMYVAGELSFVGAKVFAVTEYPGVPPEDSCRRVLQSELIDNVDIDAGNVFFPSPDACGEYDGKIAAAGGLDLAVLGIGHNAHIGYNEPATPFDSRTHVQKLTDRTKRQLEGSGRAFRSIPEQAVTMGIKTLVEAREIILLAYGQEKAAPVFEMVYGKTITYIPASFLQIPLDVTLYLDGEAAEKL